MAGRNDKDGVWNTCENIMIAGRNDESGLSTLMNHGWAIDSQVPILDKPVLKKIFIYG